MGHPADDEPRNFVWIAYYSDWSGFVVFGYDDELGCLRHAVANSMQVARLPFGVSAHEAAEGRPPDD